MTGAVILGVQKRTFRDQDPVNIAASERVGHLHDALAASGYTGHDLQQFLVRMVFCFFADDTGIFEPRDIFLDLLENRTRDDGSDLGGWLAQLFQVLNTPDDCRSKNLDDDLARFPYVNGDLFRDPLLIPSFNPDMRQRLIDACSFNWSDISPAIFGSLFQAVMDKDQRRAQGAHYTTEKNILKVIEPLFLDELRDEFRRLQARRDSRRIPELIAFQQRLGQLRFFDPACGCGNFLIIAYRELRALEIEVLKEIRPHGQLDILAELLSEVDVDQFYGIELGEFPAHIAEVALWMMDHIMNNRLSLEFGQTYTRIPLAKSPHIRHGDALEIDWREVLPPAECFKSDFSYGIGVIYNTFPLPSVPANRLQRLSPYADAILAACAAHPDATLSDLYDPDLMPADLRKAHQALDRAVDKLYRRTAFPTDRERVEHLLGLYEKMLVPLTTKPKRRRSRTRRRPVIRR